MDRINVSNVAHLKKMWTAETGDMPNSAAKDKYSPETTPFKVGSRLYPCSAKNVMLTLDAATGKEIWRYDPKVPDDPIAYGATCHAVAYYAVAQAAPDPLCGERVIEGTIASGRAR